MTVSSVSPIPCELRWYLLHCKPRQDARALENLERQGFECLSAVRRVERVHGGRKCVLDEPLFPRYVFIRLDQRNHNWSVIRSTRGVHQIVRFNEYPLPVRDELINGIRARSGATQLDKPYLKPGERVRITAGPFAQLEAVFMANEGADRVVLLLNILAQEQRLSFPLQNIRKLA